MMEDVCKIMPKTVTFYGVHSNSRQMFLNSESFIIRMPFYCESALRTPTDSQIDKYVARYMNLKIISKQKDQTVNPAPYGKPKRSWRTVVCYVCRWIIDCTA